MMQRVMQIAMVEMDAEGASVWLRGADGSLECRGAAGEAGARLAGIRVPPGKGIVGWALKRRQSVLVPDVQTDPRFYQEVGDQIGFNTRDLIAIPLVVREGSIGVLEAVNKKREPFSLADVAWMEVLASLAVGPIASAQLFQALQQRTVELQVRNEELDAFAHTVAHDLKSPMARIVGFSETLESSYTELPDDELRHYLCMMAQSGRKMSRIVDELLLLAGVRKMEVELRPLDMASIVAEAMQRLEPMIQEAQADVTLPKTWPAALGYGPWVEEVWINYVSNAIKYGGQPPRVELGAISLGSPQEEGNEGAMVRFWVGDNGAGLTPEAQARLFTPFTRLDQVRTEGHGLGLSIVRRIVEKLGGQVGVESTVGQGSIFSFTLPGCE
jgi:signal transduction histidine kinase